jgi:hypothetical protein
VNDDGFSFSRWAILFPVLSVAAFVVATAMMFTTPSDAAASANERRLLYAMVAFLGLSALIQGNALFQIERRLRALSARHRVQAAPGSDAGGGAEGEDGDEGDGADEGGADNGDEMDAEGDDASADDEPEPS